VLVVVYVAVQQAYREGLNDPQIQMAEDAALKLQGGTALVDVVPAASSGTVDIAKSLSPWLVVYDAGVPVQSTATYAGGAPKLPSGLLDASTWSKAKVFTYHGMQETRVTWQPEPGVRQATVIVHVSNGTYVASGRNMREGEQRIERLGEMLFAAWVVTLAVLLVLSFGYSVVALPRGSTSAKE
jgi:hypothetical protein